MILLDTHALVWLALGAARLGGRRRKAATDALAAERLCASAISFWEVAQLVARGRLVGIHEPSAFRRRVLETGIRDLPITSRIAVDAVSLIGLSRDPADRFIVATTLVHEATLITADEALLAWSGSLRTMDARR